MRLTLNRAAIGPSLAVAAFSTVLWVSVPEAHAGTACDHRSLSHLAEHGGRAADDAYHVARGEAPSCNSDSGGQTRDSDDREDNAPGIHHRDRIKPTWRDLF